MIKHLKTDHPTINRSDDFYNRLSGVLYGDRTLEQFRKDYGTCPACHTDAMSWNGRNLGEHMRQSHGANTVKEFAEELRSM